MGLLKSKLHSLTWPPSATLCSQRVRQNRVHGGELAVDEFESTLRGCPNFKSNSTNTLDSQTGLVKSEGGNTVSRFRKKISFRNILNKSDTSNLKGVLDVTSTDLVFRYRENGQLLCQRWPISSLRRYGCGNGVFVFECGRRCPSGEGLYLFKCKKSSHLYKRLKEEISRECVSKTCRNVPMWTFSDMDVELGGHAFPSRGHSSSSSHNEYDRTHVNGVSSARSPAGNVSHTATNPCPTTSRGAAASSSFGTSGQLMAEMRSRPGRDSRFKYYVSHSPTSTGTSHSSAFSSGGSASTLGRTTLSHLTCAGGGGGYLIAAPEPVYRHNYVNDPRVSSEAAAATVEYIQIDHSNNALLSSNSRLESPPLNEENSHHERIENRYVEDPTVFRNNVTLSNQSDLLS